MNWRKLVYFSYATFRGYRFPRYLRQYQRELKRGTVRETAKRALTQMLQHCRDSVPYYADCWAQAGLDAVPPGNPYEALRRLPILTKDLIRANQVNLQAKALSHRHWFYNTSGGSTGEPICLIQDSDYADRSAALAELCHCMLGRDTGQPLVRLWGSERDLAGRTESRKASFFNWLTNTRFLNAFRMDEERMREFLRTIDKERPRLVLAYAQAIYELARFAERERITVTPPRAIATSAGTLYPFMRERIAAVFACPVFNLYGSREVSDIACELPGQRGLWVPPWGNFVEIVDEDGGSVPAGTEGNILITCLTNYAMPLLRYQIGDRGALLPEAEVQAYPPGQRLHHVSGRTVDAFRTRDHTLVDGEYFTHLLYFRPWVWKFQVVQKDYTRVVFKVIKTNHDPAPGELADITSKARLVMGKECCIDFEFVGELPPHPSGKFRYTISEVVA